VSGVRIGYQVEKYTLIKGRARYFCHHIIYYKYLEKEEKKKRQEGGGSEGFSGT